MKQYWQDANGENMRSSSKSSDVVLAGNPLHGESDNFGPAKFTTEMTSRSAAPAEEVKGADDIDVGRRVQREGLSGLGQHTAWSAVTDRQRSRQVAAHVVDIAAALAI